MSISVPYADFQNARGLLAENGGPWRTELSTDSFCFSSSAGFCRDVGCMMCNVYVYSSMRTFTNKIFVNISVPMAQYGNANSLDFTFGYSLDWMSDKTAAGTPLSSRLTVGSASFTDNFVSVQYRSDPSLGGNPFSHSGTTSVTKSSDGTVGYIPVTIDFTFTRELNSLLDWWMKGLGFQITTQTTPVSVASVASASPSTISSSTIGLSSQAPSIPSPSLSNVILPNVSYYSTSSGMFDVPVSSARSDSDASSSRKDSVPPIIIGVMGGIFLLGAIAIFLLLLYRKKMRKLEQRRLEWRSKDENGGSEWMSGEDASRRTSYSEWFLPNPAHRVGGSKATVARHWIDPGARPDSRSFAITPSYYPATSSYESDQAESRHEGNDEGRSPRLGPSQQQSTPNYASVLYPRIPPPAYSTTSQTTHEPPHRNKDSEEDEGLENPGTNDRRALPTGQLEAMGQ
ncbi:hypothetical protein FRC19_001428 [Serendipita sp. 401]|nr:hypothetical protein FRC19_001428 [Serendipita sp. 401]